jgi:aminoglycoside 3-N-acetyltransferase
VAGDLLSRSPITRTELCSQLERLGVRAGEVLMVHCSLSSLGYVVGGADSVVPALLDVLGPGGTLVAMTGWEHDAYALEEWPPALQEAYRRDPPAFDPDVSESQREYGRLPERIRTWPGARNSSHPECRFTAIGHRAAWITAAHPRHHPYGAGSPLAKLVECDGSVLMLGAPLESITLLHHAEERARVANKRIVEYSCPIRTATGVEWIRIEDIDTAGGALPYERVVGDRDSFEVIARDALDAGIGASGRVGDGDSHIFGARALLDFAVAWMEERFA